MGMSVVGGAAGNGVIGEGFLKLELRLGWSHSLFAYHSLGYLLEEGL